MIFLQTARLLLRNLSPTDLDALYDYRNNEGCARYQHWENTSKEYLREWIERYAQSAFLSKEPEQHYAICRATGAADGQIIGDLSYFYNEADPCITLGYTISYRHWRQGYAFEMLRALLPAIQNAYPQTDIVALVEKENVPSIALLQKRLCGGGVFRENQFRIFVKPPSAHPLRIERRPVHEKTPFQNHPRLCAALFCPRRRPVCAGSAGQHSVQF